ncbi:MAG: carbohydrate ABC transporter permease [Clostridia bacterium]|nr:carbohydrate ABC transporter permease [Clostridia bacterium]
MNDSIDVNLEAVPAENGRDPSAPESGNGPKKIKRRKSTRIKQTPADIVFDVIKYVILVVSLVLVILPMLNILALSFSNGVYNSKVSIIPLGINFKAYVYVLSESLFLQAFGNSVLATVLVTILSTVCMSMAAYPLSKIDCPFKKGITTFFIITMLFSAGIIPGYILMMVLGLTDTIWSIIIISINNVYNMLLFKSNFLGIPNEIEEAAKIDGASSIQLFFIIVIPLCLPVFASCAFFTIVGTWNSYGGALMYIQNNRSAQPLALYLYKMLQTDAVSVTDPWRITNKSNIEAATLIISVIPVLLVYPYVIKYIKSGLTIGSVKE